MTPCWQIWTIGVEGKLLDVTQWTQVEVMSHVVLYSGSHKFTLSKTPPCGLIYHQQMCKYLSFKNENLWSSASKPPWTQNKQDCGAIIPYHLIWFFLFPFPLRLFVRLFPWLLLSFLRRYVHLLFPNASPSPCSQVLSVVCHALVLIFVFPAFIQEFFVYFFWFFCFSLLTHLTHLSFRCLSVQSLITLVVCPHSFISVGGCRAVTGCLCCPVGSALGSDALWPLYWAVRPSCLCMLWWSLSLICFVFFGSCIIPFFPK